MDNKVLKEWWKKQNVDLSEINPIVIWEGCDGVGKTTWMNVIMETTGHTFVFHTSAPLKNMDKDYYYNILKNFLTTASTLKQPLFIDRFHIGELVYGTIFRPNNTTEDIEIQMYELEEALSSLNTKILYLTADSKVISDRLSDRGDWYIKQENIQTILSIYEDKLKKSKLPIYILNNDIPITDEKIIEVIKFIYDI